MGITNRVAASFVAYLCLIVLSGCTSLSINVRDFPSPTKSVVAMPASSRAISHTEQNISAPDYFPATVIIAGFLNTSSETDKQENSLERRNMPMTKHLTPAIHYDIIEDKRVQGNRPTKMGVGVIIEISDDRVVILTNNHVRANVDKLTATLFDGREYPAAVLWASRDSDFDVAFLEIRKRNPADPAESFTAAKLGDSDLTSAGDRYLMIGHPYGLFYSAHYGNLAQMRYSFFAENDAILQMNMNIFPGNSGSPLFNKHGLVDGLVFATRTEKNGQIMAIGWAIPINPIKEKFKEIRMKK